MELKNQIVEMDALSNSQKISTQKIQKKIENVKVLKWIEIPLPKLKFKKNCLWELNFFNTVLIFILESWDLKTCEYVFDVKTCKQKVAQGTTYTAGKSCSRIKHDQSKACPTIKIWHSKSIFKINIEINIKFNIFSENVIFQLILKKSIKKDQININKKSI